MRNSFSTINLEAEIIVYRHLLDSSEVQIPVAINVQTRQQIRSATTEHFVVQNERTRKGTVGIRECEVTEERERNSGIYFVSSEDCAANGTYISLMNHSTNADVDISGWMLKRRIDSVTEVRYTLPDGVYLQKGSALTIYAAAGASAVESLKKRIDVSSLSHQELVNKDLDSWGT